jgi:hypothetical protein
MKTLSNVTLIGIDCVDLKRLQLAADISTKEISFGAVKLLSSIQSNDPRTVMIRHLGSVQEYSDFMIKELDKYIDTEFALVFQYDGFILNPNAWSDEFLNYDYIGAPWYHLGPLRVGNGGFSLRSKKLTSWLSKNWPTVKSRINPEDIYISRFARPFLEHAGMKFAPEDVASRFSKEGNERSVAWNGEFGFHGILYTDISRWLDKHPEYKQELTYELNDYVTLMKKYPVYDGSVHTLRFGKYDMTNYIQNAQNNKQYEIRITKEKYYNMDDIKLGDMIVFKRSGVTFKEVSVPAFEKKVTKIEKFKSLKQLRSAYPKLHVTYPYDLIKKWERPFVRFLGDFVYPQDKQYTLFWFT